MAIKITAESLMDPVAGPKILEALSRVTDEWIAAQPVEARDHLAELRRLARELMASCR